MCSFMGVSISSFPAAADVEQKIIIERESGEQGLTWPAGGKEMDSK